MHICVIGASRGIGKALAIELERQGHEVWACARSPSTAVSRSSVVDITDDASVTQWIEEMDLANWKPDIVVLNAAVQLEDMVDAYDHERGRQILRVNLDGVLRCVDAFLPRFLEKGSGSFVAICSTAALRPSIRSASYAASKAGLAMAFRSLRLRYAKQGIRFATAYLGPIATEMWEGKTGMLVPSADRAASALASFVCSGRTTLWYPRISTWLLRLSMVLPDSVFAALSGYLLRK